MKAVIDCKHYFCVACILKWADIENTCPLCKQPFQTIREKRFLKIKPESTGSQSSSEEVSVTAVGNKRQRVNEQYTSQMDRMTRLSHLRELLNELSEELGDEEDEEGFEDLEFADEFLRPSIERIELYSSFYEQILPLNSESDII
jgi:hypothetical protein